jgi:hypothetical protein
MALDLTAALSGIYDKPIDNGYGIAASAIGQSIPALVNPYGSVGGNFATVAGASLLSALLGSFARQDAAEVNAQQALSLGQFMGADPTARAGIVKENPRLSPLYAALSLQQMEDDRTNKMETIKAGIAGKQKIAEIEAQNINKVGEIGATNLQKSLTDGLPQYVAGDGTVKTVPGAETNTGMLRTPKAIKEEEDAARTEINKLPSVLQFQAMQKALPLVKAFKDQDTKSSDMGFVYNYVKANDDGAVRGEEINMAESTNPLINKYRAQLQGALTGQSALTPALKNQMYEELVGGRKNVYEQAKQDSLVRVDIAKRRGVATAENLYPFKIDLEFGDAAPPPPPPSDYTPAQRAAALEMLNQRLGK